MLSTQSNRFEGSRIGRELVGHDPRGSEAILLEQLLHELPGGLGVAPRLDEEVQFLTIVVDGAPQPLLLAVDAHHHLVEVPVVARPRPQAPQVGGDGRTEFQEPSQLQAASRRFIRGVIEGVGGRLNDMDALLPRGA